MEGVFRKNLRRQEPLQAQASHLPADLLIPTTLAWTEAAGRGAWVGTRDLPLTATLVHQSVSKP